MALASLHNLRTALRQVLAVVRPGDERLGDLFRSEGVEVVVCEQASLGMGHSLAAGIAASKSAGGWVIALGDMPAIAPATIASIADKLQQTNDIIVPYCGAQRGHPVAFPADLVDELMGLEGDQGARMVLNRHEDRVHNLAVTDPGVLLDVDRKEDLPTVSRL